VFPWNKNLKPEKDWIQAKLRETCQKNIVLAGLLIVTGREKEGKLKLGVLPERQIKSDIKV
jgi:hypothetical protein